MSTLTEALIVNGLVLFAVLEADLGPHRKIGRLRLLRPLLLAASVVPLFLEPLVTHGHGLAIEILAVAAGAVLGLAASALMRVYRSPSTGKPATRAGFGYASLWIAIVGARSAFSIGATRWFSHPLASWMIRNHVSADAITDGLILMAVTMVVVRTGAIAARAAALPSTATATSEPILVAAR